MDTIVFTLVQLQYEAYIQPPMLPNSVMKQLKEYYNLEQPKEISSLTLLETVSLSLCHSTQTENFTPQKQLSQELTTL